MSWRACCSTSWRRARGSGCRRSVPRPAGRHRLSGVLGAEETATAPAPTGSARGRKGTASRTAGGRSSAPDAATDAADGTIAGDAPATADGGVTPTDGRSEGETLTALEADASTASRTPAAERRRAAETLIALWTDVARDLVLAGRGLSGSVRELGLLDETVAAAATVDLAELSAFLERLGRAGVLLAGNVSPELVLDDLALAWPRATSRAA